MGINFVLNMLSETFFEKIFMGIVCVMQMLLLLKIVLKNGNEK
jgi:hypothetical protein